MGTDSFTVCIKTDHIYKDIAKDFKRRSDNLSYELGRPLPRAKNVKIIGLITWKNDAKFVGVRAKTYDYWIDVSEDRKAKAQKCVIKRNLKFENYKNRLERTQFQSKITI